jgi:MFS transporter, DHA1 family, inner membrane transport protein
LVSHDSPNRTDVPLRAYAALIALSIAAFCYVATETLPIGLLPLISNDLGVSLSETGLLVTGYAATVCIVTLPLAYVTQRMPRRRLMAALLAILVAATLVTATAQNYPFLFSARIVAALTQALFWAVVAPAAAGMFPVHVRGRVTSVVFAGASLAPMLGVPAGTWLGQQVGWRAAFFALAGLAFLAFAAVALLMPTVPTGVGQAATGTRPNARRYWVTVSVTALSVAGLFSAFTYTAVFLTNVAGFAPAAIGLLLLIRGLADFAGIAVGGVLTDRNQRLAIILPAVLLAVSLGGLYAVPAAGLAVVGSLAVSGFAMGGLTTALQNRVMEVAPGSTDLASAGNSVAYNVGIATGSLLGALVVAEVGIRATALVGSVLAALALVVFTAEPLIAGVGRGKPARESAAQPRHHPAVD